MVSITVEYCGSWGYGSRFDELYRVVKAKVPQADIRGSVGRRTSFEVTVDGNLIHSKLQTMAFPDYDEVADIVMQVAGGNAARQVTKTHSGSCTIL